MIIALTKAQFSKCYRSRAGANKLQTRASASSLPHPRTVKIALPTIENVMISKILPVDKLRVDGFSLSMCAVAPHEMNTHLVTDTREVRDFTASRVMVKFGKCRELISVRDLMILRTPFNNLHIWLSE